MVGGFLKGAVAGAIVSGLALGTASVLMEGPADRSPRVDTVEVTPGSGFDPRREDRAASVPAPETRPDPGAPAQVTPAAPGDAVPRAETDSAPASAPMTDGADTLGPAPEGSTGDTARMTAADGPVAPRPPAPMQDAPRSDDRPARPASAPANTEAPSAEAPALRRNAAAFTNSGNRPLMAILLMEAAGSTVTFEMLESFPYPLSIALDPDRRGAADAAARYRDAGFEVVLAVDLPRNVSPEEARAALQDDIAQVRQAVAVLEDGAGGLPVAGAATILGRSGHGLVTRATDFDPARAVLAASGVPAATLQNDLDGQWQGTGTIEATLDEAAAAAENQRGVIVLGRMRAGTLRALSSWAGRGGARRVALAPVSAVLSAQPGR
ncbi:divergent polysaccharide deacetylase family protein [Roseovarius sp. D22-M7]|uniref:divergent polysaccharide deacetylase family protein n=1 Tax=Roseovarius sp. D22-M7 TaxID=3127116 RepID=UPI00300FE021